FAVAALAIGAFSFPLLLDRPVPMGMAMRVSARALHENPRVIGLWGAIVAAALVIGSIPALLGLVVVLPVLGHATWHLYRRIVE
ncbi:MAG TPA: transporter, partial [Acetobacteraceae bacterium]|nr:transporter [Acetobacteraceae bacterium]